MNYRLATFNDWPSITEYINQLDYFMPVDPSQLGGVWIVAIDESAQIHGTLWFFGAAPNAYVDYWAARSGVIAGKLAAFFQGICSAVGIKYVRAVIARDHEGALRMATQGFGMVESNADYKLVFRSI
jgi:hypothetical protein